MSEKNQEKKMFVELKPEDRQLLQSVIEAQKPPPKEDVNPDHPTHSLEDLLECPDCYPKVKEAVLKKEIVSRKDKEFECVDCGTRVDRDEESCPTCGGKEARHRD